MRTAKQSRRMCCDNSHQLWRGDIGCDRATTTTDSSSIPCSDRPFEHSILYPMVRERSLSPRGPGYNGLPWAIHAPRQIFYGQLVIAAAIHLGASCRCDFYGSNHVRDSACTIYVANGPFP